MSDGNRAPDGTADELSSLREKADRLERELAEAGTVARERLIRAELRVEAVRAGMGDLDGLKLADLGKVSIGEDGEVQGGAALMSKLRTDKPWLFAQASSSSVASPPPGGSVKPRMASEMSLEEWRAARAELLRRR